MEEVTQVIQYIKSPDIVLAKTGPDSCTRQSRCCSCYSRCKPPLMLSDPAFEASRRVSAGTLSGRCPDSADRPLSDRAPHGPPESSRRSTKMRPGLQGALASVMTGPLGGIEHVDGESNRSRTHCSDLC